MDSKIIDFINLNKGEEQKEKVLENVKSNISFRGANVWILACAIVIASVGLTVNSTAVIIGAMLISPLMGPIVGAGFALAMYDFELLKKSAKNLLIATIVSLLVATIFFYCSPFKDAQSELLARTSPNIYDVLIAFFGGLVGVIALTRVEKGNPIPGVAIATALMPPLCTAGYGIAVGNYTYFFGAFYLYIINCFFICISTFFIVKYLKYPPVTAINIKLQKRIRFEISILIVVMLVPSFYLAYNLLQEKKYTQKVDFFINNEITNKGYTIIYKRTKFNTNPKKIELALLTKKFTNDEVLQLNKKLLAYQITNTAIEIKQDSKDIKSDILNEIGVQNKVVNERNSAIDTLQKELAFYKNYNNELLKEIAILFPEIKNASFGKHQIHANTDSATIITVMLYEEVKKAKLDKEKMINWLREKLGNNQIELVKK